jgi:hypothetical protein
VKMRTPTRLHNGEGRANGEVDRREHPFGSPG